MPLYGVIDDLPVWVNGSDLRDKECCVVQKVDRSKGRGGKPRLLVR